MELIKRMRAGVSELRTLFPIIAVGLVGCTSSQQEVLGPPPTTTEAVIEEVVNNVDRQKQGWKLENVLPSEDGLRRYHSYQGMGDWVPNAKYAKNERLLIYIYPQRDAVGGITPGHAIEIPLYKQVHILMPGEY